VLCLYDNAGEHFLPGADSSTQPTTRHLARSQVLLYLFDPTQDPRFRQLYRSATGDDLPAGKPMRQELVLREAIARIRKLTGMSPDDRHHRPLIVVVTKYDVWKPLFDQGNEREVVRWGKDRSSHTSAGSNHAGLDREAMLARSQALRELLLQACPEVVSVAEGFARGVLYWPASPLGTPPLIDETGVPCVRPGSIQPVGVTAPLLLSLQLTVPGLIAGVRRSGKRRTGPAGTHLEKEGR
jgi:hypothetical protein